MALGLGKRENLRLGPNSGTPKLLGLKNLKNLHFRSDLENWYKFLFFRIG